MGVTFRKTHLPGVMLCELKVYGDDRGFFTELFQAERYAEAGMDRPFVQDNFVHSAKNVVRGLHYQLRQPQAKLVSAVSGVVFDVAVDIRRNSPTNGQWVGTILSSDNHRQLYIPEGFAHGYCVLSDTADIVYKCTDFYAPDDDFGIRWDDPDIGIDWPVRDAVLSDKDRGLRPLKQVPEADLPVLVK